jgi:hypothetical protein
MSTPEKKVRRALMVAKSVPPDKIRHDELKARIAAGDIPKSPVRVTNRYLADAVDKALAYHLSLSDEQRAINSLNAELALAPYLGRTKKGVGNVKDVLGKNMKLLKTEKGYKGGEPLQMPDGKGIETTGLAFSPAYQDGNFNMCPNRHACKTLCLGLTSGGYHAYGGGEDITAIKGPRLASLLKTLAFLHNPGAFAVKLHDELQAAKEDAAARGSHQGVRLNVLSDIPPRVWRSLMNAHSDISFYDYTKLGNDPIAPNHHLTYSSTGVNQPEATYDVEAREANPEKNIAARAAAKGKGVINPHQNWHDMRDRMNNGYNVAMAFSHKKFLPQTVYDEETGKTYRVVDGDTHDFRPFDRQPGGTDGVVIGLRNKQITAKSQNAAYLSNGFFVHYDPQEERPDKYERGPSPGMSKKTGKPLPGPILNPGKPTNTEVRIAPQPVPSKPKETEGMSGDVQGANRPLRAAGGGVSYAGGGFVVDPHGGLEEEAYAHQFPGLEHHEEQDEDTVRRKWWERKERGGIATAHHTVMSSPDIAIRIARSVIRK